MEAATQNPHRSTWSKEWRDVRIAAGTRIVARGSRMGCTLEFVEIFEQYRRKGKARVYGMLQGRQATAVVLYFEDGALWSEVDAKLKGIIPECYNTYLKLCYSLQRPSSRVAVGDCRYD
ncbi:hypothetical protein E1B28_005201 [Marasmius oreades]|uniref:Uncharacterized protein n=1 Tax=Marasmius oreades TaxID=181124 RepID=A0A9P8ADW1_9AGAR|nr:uncharacterized protein E1B28_005201 [Marasmius oreades]KAG7097888.1 hypothetical protein E1B28_005201 [Marasmius oreades]